MGYVQHIPRQFSRMIFAGFRKSNSLKRFSQVQPHWDYLDRAVLYIQGGYPDSALADVETALKTAANYPPAIGTKAMANINLGNYVAALADLGAFIQQFPNADASAAWLYYISRN